MYAFQSGGGSDLLPHGTRIRKSASVGMLPREQAKKVGPKYVM